MTESITKFSEMILNCKGRGHELKKIEEVYLELVLDKDLDREEEELLRALRSVASRLTGKTLEKSLSSDSIGEETRRSIRTKNKSVPNCEECAFSSYKKENGIRMCYCGLRLFDTVPKIVGKGEKLTCKSFILDRLEGCRQICMDGFEADFDD